MAGCIAQRGDGTGKKMRLVCPNCGAQYEVDDRVMPENGRDVQCSACGHAWFQRGPHAAEEDAVGAVAPSSPTSTPVDGTEDAPLAHSQDRDEEQAERGEEAAADRDGGEDTSGADTPPPIASRRPLDPDVQAILQQEAQRELEARQSQQEQIETQTEMGLDDVADEEAQRKSIRERMARLRGAEDEFEAAEALPEGRGRDLLPDIEEINSTLDADHDIPSDAQQNADASGRAPGGFRRGFMTTTLLAVMLLAIYVYSPVIAEKLPQVKSPLDSYVTFVDQARTGLNGMMESAIHKMQGLNGEGA